MRECMLFSVKRVKMKSLNEKDEIYLALCNLFGDQSEVLVIDTDKNVISKKQFEKYKELFEDESDSDYSSKGVF